MASKRKTEDGGSRQPRKLRRLSGFNIWHREFLKSADAQALSSLSEKNKVSSAKWRLLTEEQRQEYNNEATQAESRTTSEKKEMRRVLSNLSNLAEHIKDNVSGCEMMFTVIRKNTHYCGGTEKGCQYLEQEAPWIPYSFMGSLAAKPGTHSLNTPNEDLAEPTQLRVHVEKLFNHLYGLQVNNSAARLPYSKIEQYGISIEGLPEGKTLKHPSSYGPRTLKAILSSKDSIKLKVLNPPQPKKPAGKRPSAVGGDDSSGRKDNESSPSTFLSVATEDQTVELRTCDSTPTCVDEVNDQSPLSPIVCKPDSANPISVDHTYAVVVSESTTETRMTLVNSHGQPVGIASTLGGDILHGKPIPLGYTKVAIEYIKPGTAPMFSTGFDDEELHTGQLTAWATKYMYN